MTLQAPYVRPYPLLPTEEGVPVPAHERRGPVFVDPTGHRRTLLGAVALCLGGLCLAYLFFMGFVVSGLVRPVGPTPPDAGTSVPAPHRGEGSGAREMSHGEPAPHDGNSNRDGNGNGKGSGRGEAPDPRHGDRTP